MERKMIALMGEEGQVLSAKNALLPDGNFDVKLVQGKQLRYTGTQLTEAGTNRAGNNSSVLTRAFENCYGVFIAHTAGHENVFVLEDFIIDAAAEAGVAHVVFAMPAFQHISKLEYAFQYRQIKEALKSIEDLRQIKISVLRTPVFYEQIVSPDFLSFNDDGKGLISAAHLGKNIPAAALADLGFVLKMIFRFSGCYSQRIVGLVGDNLPYEEYLRQIYSAAGIGTAGIAPLQFNLPGSQDISLGGFAFADAPLSFLPDSIESYGLHPGMQPFSRWLKRNLRSINNQLAPMLPSSRAIRRA
jgi:hypothetical protein